MDNPHKWRPKKTRKITKKRIVRISHEEIDSAVEAYLAHGGTIEQLKIESRSLDEIPRHYEDTFL